MFLSPMLLQKSETAPVNDDFDKICELKADGIRFIYSKFKDKVKLYTRHHNEVTALFPELVNIPIPNGTVLDGELIVTDPSGKPDFEAMMSRLMSKKLIGKANIQLMVFDILYFENERVTFLPLIERKELLERLIPPNQQAIVATQWVEGHASEYFDVVKQHDLEGIVCKSKYSTYQVGKRSSDWIKVINYKFTDVYVTGLRKKEFGLVLRNEAGTYLGVMEFVPSAARKQFYTECRPLITNETKEYINLKPKMRCKVKYRNLTKKGLLRIPSFVEWLD